MIALVSVPLIIFLIYSSHSFYQAQLKKRAFQQKIQGMDEYELCQLAVNEFGMKMVVDMGCLAGNQLIKQG